MGLGGNIMKDIPSKFHIFRMIRFQDMTENKRSEMPFCSFELIGSGSEQLRTVVALKCYKNFDIFMMKIGGECL